MCTFFNPPICVLLNQRRENIMYLTTNQGSGLFKDTLITYG